ALVCAVRALSVSVLFYAPGPALLSHPLPHLALVAAHASGQLSRRRGSAGQRTVQAEPFPEIHGGGIHRAQHRADDSAHKSLTLRCVPLERAFDLCAHCVLLRLLPSSSSAWNPAAAAGCPRPVGADISPFGFRQLAEASTTTTPSSVLPVEYG